MLTEIVKRLPEYKNAVITGVDARGLPFSFRCTPQPDLAAGVLRLQVPQGSDIQPGPASLLCHKHDEQFWNQHSFIAWGKLKKNDRDWDFIPERFTPGADTDLLSLFRFVTAARRTARQYLEKRHLPRPEIPWNDIKALWAEAKRTSNENNQ